MRFSFLTACTVTSIALSASAANLLENGSFEQPVVTGRTIATAGGNPAVGADPTSFASLTATAANEGGNLQIGVTTDIARTGKQALFIDFQNVSAVGVRAAVSTKPVPIEANRPYRVSIWARIDRKRPLALDESRPLLWIELRFLKEDQATEVGEPIAGSQHVPGEIFPGGPHPLTFTSLKWKESNAEFEAPDDARFVKISWYLITTEEKGGTDGVLYLDDAALQELEVLTPEAGAETADEDAPTADASSAVQPSPSEAPAAEPAAPQ